MSRSRTFRCVSLSAADRADLRGRILADIGVGQLTRLKRFVEEELAGLSSRHSPVRLSTRRLGALVRSAATIEQLASVATQIDQLREPSSGGRQTGVSDRFAVARAQAELESIEKLARGRLVDAPDTTQARRLLQRARDQADRGEGGEALRLLARAGGDLAKVNDTVLEEVAAAECRKRTIDVVTNALVEMGYSVDTRRDGSDEVVVEATASDGRAAHVSVAGTKTVNLDSLFTDKATAVDPGHPDATELCEPAVLDSFTLARAINDSPLEADRPVAVGRPTRGSRSGRSVRATKPTTERRRRA